LHPREHGVRLPGAYLHPKDPRLAPFFHNVTVERAISKQFAFLSDLLSGERHYFGLQPFNAHHWMIISDELFDYREAIFDGCVQRQGVPEHLHRRWRALHEQFRREIVKSAARGILMDGVERVHHGFSLEVIEVATVCDGCFSEMVEGSRGRMHPRTGQLYCGACAARPAILAASDPAAP